MNLPHVPLVPSDVEVLVNLKQGDEPTRTARYEWETLLKIPTIERLIRNMVEGPALPLHWQDEFRAGHRHLQVYYLNPEGRLCQIITAVMKLDEICGAIPVSHLSPWVQALHRVFLSPSGLLTPMSPHHPVINTALNNAMTKEKRRPAEAFDYRYWENGSNAGFDLKQARALIDQINPYYICLADVIKQAEVKRAQRNRVKQAFKHHARLERLFNATLQTYPKILLVYLELKCPEPSTANYHDDEQQRDREAYERLNQARAAFIKSRYHHPLFHGLIGYAWKYRHSHGQGLICSMALLFDASLESQLYGLTHELGKHWLSVAPEGSSYWAPVRSHATVSDNQYFGLLEAKDDSVEEGLQALARLMTLYDVYIRPAPPKKMHVFDASEPPTPPRPKRRKRATSRHKNLKKSPPLVAAYGHGKNNP